MSQAKDQHRRTPRKPKKFRSQVLHAWLVDNYDACKAADIGGGKGLLAYLLQQDGWDVTVIDPEYQELPLKYTDLNKNKVVIPNTAAVPHITSRFDTTMAERFDLLIGLHVHGSCMKMIDAAALYGCDIVLLPCCVIDEPIEKEPNINWRESLIAYAISKGLSVQTEKLNFMGKDIAIFTHQNLSASKR